ncbi:hypothetical protein LCGC14_0489590 [marine sediment metagenome]|uniref:Terminase large subunit gp17-like C-terminal domain-containing protein n=1 Tax=marine sediment metagenome TaxID=412755 RepID=A0A0F9SC62_9ZZZZ
MAKAAAEQWSPSSMVDAALASDLDPGIFSTIDEGDVPKSGNFLDFCINKKFLNVLPYPRQVEVGLMFFEEYCPDCSNPAWLFGDERDLDLFDQPMGEILENIKLLEFGVCPKCGQNRNDFVKKGYFHNPYELAGCAGQRSGKSAVIAMIAAYVLHRYLCIPDPIRTLGLLSSSQLYMSMTAISAGQAEASLWTPFKEYVDQAPWFVEYHKLLADTGERLGTELLHRPRTFLVYQHKRIACMYEAPNKRRLRGKTRFFTAIDEIGWMEADAAKQSVTMSADEISASLDNSLRTVRSMVETLREKRNLFNLPDGYACNISSPSDKNDRIMRSVRSARTNRKIYAYHYPTWEANPFISRASLQPEYDKSKMVAERDFGAVPPLANDPFIDNPNCVDLMIVPDHKHNLIQVKMAYNTDDFGNKTKYASVKVPHIDKRKPRMLLVDAGEKRNHFAVMLMTWDTKMNRARVDYVFDVPPEEGIPINFALMWEHCFLPLVQGLLIKHMFSDTWNSTDLVQKLRQHKVMSEQYTLKFMDLIEIAARLSSGELMLPKPELPVEDLRLTYENPTEFVDGKPILGLILQMLTVRQVGRRVVKPVNGEDDMFRALALGMYHIIRPEIKRIYAVDAAGGAGGNLGVISSRSAGSAGIDPRKRTSGAILATKRGYRNR